MDFNTKQQSIFSELETWADDDLQVLQEFGAAYYSTAQLMDIRGQLRERINWLDRRHRTLLSIVVSAIGWAAFGYVAYFFQMNMLTNISFALFLVSVLVYCCCIYFLRIRNSTRTDLHQLVETVEDELKKRRMMSIKGL
jgi:hypothetical protein